ncbi:hypothetical protein [Frankia sp. AgB32]|uniref:hypothetical protein n=1 Tax=Frankia sp. AgB32 TaxID=631119 RepID=UPI00200C1F83|nr:hypothetical protein [Frankia sp. AgB32]MCK9894010.1 hypothetical protein [Frankia sp. AgB32]
MQVGRQWARWFRWLRLSPEGTVIEIGPGFSAKIGLGLAAIGFRGNLLLVEPNASARRWAQAEYCRLLPNARVLTSPVSLPAARGLPAEPVDLLAANHVLDDVILNACLPVVDAERVFGAMRAGSVCSDGVVRTWRHLASSPGQVDEAVERMVADFALYLERCRPARFVVNEYPSWRHSSRGLHLVHDVGLRAIRELALRLEPDFRSVVRTCPALSSMSWLISSRQVATGGAQA